MTRGTYVGEGESEKSRRVQHTLAAIRTETSVPQARDSIGLQVVEKANIGKWGRYGDKGILSCGQQIASTCIID
jgi:hypothetical protein